MSSFSMDTRLAWTHARCLPRHWSIASSKNRLFKTAPDIDQPPFQFIHTMDLSVADTMLHESPDLVIHRTEIWAVWRPQVWCKKVWRFDAAVKLLHMRVAVCRCTVLLEYKVATRNFAYHWQLSMTSLWHCEAASKKSVRDIARISCFVTTVKLPHALQIYSTVFVKKCMRLAYNFNSERIIKCGQYLQKLRSNEKGFSFLTRSVDTICKFANYSLHKFILKISSVDEINCLCLFYYHVYLWSVFLTQHFSVFVNDRMF